MVGKTAHRTKADQARFDALKDMGLQSARHVLPCAHANRNHPPFSRLSRHRCRRG